VVGKKLPLMSRVGKKKKKRKKKKTKVGLTLISYLDTADTDFL